jgi:hypothetical protein
MSKFRAALNDNINSLAGVSQILLARTSSYHHFYFQKLNRDDIRARSDLCLLIFLGTYFLQKYSCAEYLEGFNQPIIDKILKTSLFF